MCPFTVLLIVALAACTDKAPPPGPAATTDTWTALRANERTGRFVIDTLWDRPTHFEDWYFRSDHLPYARLGVPGLMYSTNLHEDYHTAGDIPERIDYAKLTRMARWMYLTGVIVPSHLLDAGSSQPVPKDGSCAGISAPAACCRFCSLG